MRSKRQNIIAVSEHMKRTKRRLVNGFGGQCAICGYSKCYEALDFHHDDPSDKTFSIGSQIPRGRKWDELVIEAQKCYLLCSNCHRELHNGAALIPKNARRFIEGDAIDTVPSVTWTSHVEKMNTFRKTPYIHYVCENCNTEFRHTREGRKRKFCSIRCFNLNKRKYKHPSLSTIIKSVEKIGYKDTGAIYGVSGNAIKKSIPSTMRPVLKRGPRKQRR